MGHCPGKLGLLIQTASLVVYVHQFAEVFGRMGRIPDGQWPAWLGLGVAIMLCLCVHHKVALCDQHDVVVDMCMPYSVTVLLMPTTMKSRFGSGLWRLPQ